MFIAEIKKTNTERLSDTYTNKYASFNAAGVLLETLLKMDVGNTERS